MLLDMIKFVYECSKFFLEILPTQYILANFDAVFILP